MANPPSIAQSPTWTGLGTDDLVEDLDEPPEIRSKNANRNFQRTTIRQPGDHQSSLLTKAILGQSDDDTTYDAHHHDDRRRSMASNISVTSTADLTSDTGLTSPARTNTPSPPLPEMAFLRLGNAPEPAPRKRCIQFACNAKPTAVAPHAAVPMAKAPSAQEAPRRPRIQFACPARPASTQNTPPANQAPTSQPALDLTPQACPRPAIAMPEPISPRQANFRRIQGRGSAPRPKFLRASSVDLTCDGSQFHEFARGMAREDDWIRQDTSIPRTKLTIDDTLVKENRIRRLAKEAEEEAELEEEEADDDEADDDDVMDDDDEDEDEDEYDEDEDDEDEDDEGAADGYSSDEETGFADSDEEEDDDENMILWTPVQYRVTTTTSPLPSKIRRPSLHDPHSDSSTSTGSARVRTRREKARIAIPDDTPDLPDSTDFVCGTLDEDRPLEEAYLSCLAARRNEKLRVIPQDIDPSFPASDPEDEEEEELYNPVHHSSDDEEMWMQGKMEDLDHGEGRTRRKKRGDGASPKRYHSPPPKARCRSPKPLFERGSPRRVRSPAPKAMTTPAGSPRQGTNVKFQLAGRPGLIHTKSLPRPGAFFHMKNGRYPKHHHNHHTSDGHVRGAIDIVKGLEKKRQRRKEKFHQKYCDRARRGQIPERKPLPGRGAERMKELGLLMAGKKDQGNYVLSI
jgi:hypothetical protein